MFLRGDHVETFAGTISPENCGIAHHQNFEVWSKIVKRVAHKTTIR